MSVGAFLSSLLHHNPTGQTQLPFWHGMMGSGDSLNIKQVLVKEEFQLLLLPEWG